MSPDPALTTSSGRRIQALATWGLAAPTIAAVIGLQRLFTATDFLAPTLAVAIGAHALSAAGRRIGLRSSLSAAITLGVTLGLVVCARYGSLVPPRVPGRDTFDRIGTDLVDAWTLFGSEGAPAPSAPGYLLTVMIAVAVGAVLADWLAFRLHAPVEALAPATGIFVFATLLSGPHQRVLSASLFLAAVLGHWLAQRALRQATGGSWLPSQLGRGSGALGRAGAAAAALAVIGAMVLAPALPGWGQSALLDIGPGGDGGDRIALSPLIDIRSRLVDQSGSVAFTVTADRPAYWRLTSLDRFDGRVWTSKGRYNNVANLLPPARSDLPQSPTPRLNHQQFRIEDLAAIWLPAAAVPRRFSADDAHVDWDPASATLVVDPDRDSADDLSYDVESQDVGPGQAFAIDPALQAEMLVLPEGFSPEAKRVAARETRGADSPGAKARALQDFFRDDFTYSLDVPPGHSSADIDGFLEQKVGYCEQFAGSYAAMARSIGLPARVAVGFTPGKEDPAAPGTYVVRGEHAHAWPEVLLPDYGWAAFEPTPGRGAPGAEGLTGVPPQQADSGLSASPESTPATTLIPRPEPAAEPSPSESDLNGQVPDRTSRTWWKGPLLALAVVAALWMGTVGLVSWLGRGRRRLRFGPVAAGWAATEDALSRAGLVRGPAETTVAFATRTRVAIAPAGDAHLALARGMARVEWAPATVEPDTAETGEQASAVIAAARRVCGPGRWAITALAPQRLRRA